jgi:Na+-driven multidrug efflux pump
LFLFKDFIIDFYKITPETYKLALQFMTVLSVTVIGTAYQMTCLTGIARGGGDTKIILINDTIHMWLIVIPAAALSAFVFGLSPVAVFICLKCDQILKCAVAAYWTNSYRWIKKI